MKSLSFLKSLEACERHIVTDIARGAMILTLFVIATYHLGVVSAVSDWTGLPALKEFDATILVVLYAIWLIGIFALRRAGEIHQILSAHHRLQKQMKDELQIKSVGLMAQGAALDINNLLTVSIGCSDMVLHDAQDQSVLEGIREIRRTAEKTGKITNRLLDFARDRQFVMKPVDVNEVIAEMKTVFLQIIGPRVRYSTALQTRMSFLAQTDRVFLEQALMNLVTNAMEAMPHGGDVRIETAQTNLHDGDAGALHLPPGSYIVVTVSDTGEGIQPGQLPYLFNPYYTTRKNSAGLGLVAVRDAITRSQGSLQIQSEPSRGTTVRLYLRAC